MRRRTAIWQKWGLGLSVWALSSAGALANPEGGQVVAGQASISSQGALTEIHQTTDRAVIDWRGFDVAPGEHTRFHQPSSSSFTLNRVKTMNPSHIDGRVTANGRIAIVNPNGVYFGSGAQVDVGGLIATTADIRNDDFMNDRMVFGSAGTPGAKIVNDGRITAGEAGLVGLVAPQVENTGVIDARLGRVALASGDTFTMDMAGDDFIHVAIEEPQAQKIIQSGYVSASGGKITLSAAAARQNVDALIVNKGVIEANSVGMRHGKIVLSASGAHKTSKAGVSTVIHEGRITASGSGADEKGGHVELSGDRVGVMAGASIVVSGTKGGGTVLLGGDFQGSGTVPTAQQIFVGAGATIDARATQTGDGGKVIVWADDTTRYAGHTDVDGGASSGDGGFIEVSGKNHLDFQGTVSAAAENGDVGTLLLDPTDITISNAANNNVNGATPFSPTVDDGPSNLNVTTLQTALAAANVTVQTRATGAQLGDITVVDPVAWSANRTLTLDAHNKIYVNAAITARNTLTLTANDVDIAANLAENPSGASLVIQPKTASTTIGIAGGAGTLNLSLAELAFIQAGWNGVTIGSATGTGDIDVGARTWNTPTTIRTSTGNLAINGAQTMGGNGLALNARTIDLNATLAGTGALTLSPLGNVSVGVAGAAGTFNLATAELNNINNGFSSITIGNATSTQALIANSHTWNDPLTLRTGNANLQIAGAQTMGGNALTLSSRTIDIAANLTGTGALTLTPDASTTVGLAGGAGGYNLSTAELNFIQNGFSGITVGLAASTGAVTANAYTWNDPLTLRTGNAAIQIDGNQTMGANNLTLSSRSLTLNADLNGTGVLAVRPDTNVSVGINGGAGAYQITSAMLARMLNWTTLQLGLSTNTQPTIVNATTWLRPNTQIFGGSGLMTIAGDQDSGANNLMLRSDSNLALNGNLTGTGTLTIGQSGNTATMGLAGAAGTLNLSVAELDRIIDGWGQLVLGTAPNDGAFNIGAYTWRDNVRFQNDGGIITVSGAQNAGTNNLTIHSDVDPVINAALTGTGTLTFEQDATNTTMGVAGGAGTVNISSAELANITDGWSQLVFGRIDSTVAMAVNAATWNDDVRFQTGTGVITVAGAQDVGINDLTIRSNGNPVINAALAGSGTLLFETSTSATTMGIAGGAGTYNLSSAELANITDGWSQIAIGNTAATGNITVNAAAWNDPLEILSNTGIITIAGAQTMTANDLEFTTGALVINAALTGTGNIYFTPVSSTTSVGLAGGGGALNLTTAELNFITNGWNSITIGRSDNASGTNINAHTWLDDLTLLSGVGAITVSGAQAHGANDLTVETDSIALLSTLSGTGDLYLRPSTATESMGLAGGAGTLNFTTAELNNISNGWNLITLGRTDGTGLITANAHTWLDHTWFQTGAGGSMDIAGAQGFGVNNATYAVNNINVTAGLTGTGTLTFRPVNVGDSIGLAGAAGTLGLSSAELDQIVGGWTQIDIGRADGTGAVTLNAYSNWEDPVRFVKDGASLVNAIVVSGAQDAVAASDAAYTFDGNVVLSNDLSTDGGDIRLNEVVTLGGNAVLDSAGGDIVLGDTLTGGGFDLSLLSGAGLVDLADMSGLDDLLVRADNVTLGGALSGDTLTISTGQTASDILLGGVVADAAGLLSLTGAELAHLSGNWNAITFGRADGTGTVDLNGAVTLNNADLTIENESNILAHSTLSTGTGDVVFEKTLDGAFNLTVNGTGTRTFNDDVGAGARLGDVTFNTPSGVSAVDEFNVTSLTVASGTGAVGFAGAGANATGDIDIETAGNITGIYEGVNGVWDSGAGTISATTLFTTLDIDGAGATLTPGYIGAPGATDQTMANLIRIGGVLMPTPDPLFTFGGFVIGTPLSVPGSGSGAGSGALPDSEITRILRQPLESGSGGSAAESGSYSDSFAWQWAPGGGWNFLIDDLLFISPLLMNRWWLSEEEWLPGTGSNRRPSD
jgi:filamentous hemagglutinin family protein